MQIDSYAKHNEKTPNRESARTELLTGNYDYDNDSIIRSLRIVWDGC